MCVACGQELCKNCKGCHNVECERYTEPTDACGSKITHNRRRGEGTIYLSIPRESKEEDHYEKAL